MDLSFANQCNIVLDVEQNSASSSICSDTSPGGSHQDATMSRRESRASLGVRQNDALFEFETFKKKFLFANKQITKLNSTLSIRIEELNSQITTLCKENLRLRESEIALAKELKREREKSRKVMADTEAATLNLTKHLNYLRESLEIDRTLPTPPTPPSPKARRPLSNPSSTPSSPQGMRISRPPNIPGIYEEDEPLPSSSEPEYEEKLASPPKRRSKSKPRLSASKLPLPMTRVSSPPPLPTPPQTASLVHMDLSVAVASTGSTLSKRKPGRRQSGLLTVNTNMEALSVPRTASPAFGSPVRLEVGRAEMEEEEDIAAVKGEAEVEVVEMVDYESLERKEKRRGKTKDHREEESRNQAPRNSKDRKRLREEDEHVLPIVEAIKFKLKDVTNNRTALQPIDNTVHDQAEEPLSANRQFLATLSSQPPSRGSSSPAISAGSDAEAAANALGREKRNRKSVNYAEPKLNTKMRKPDPSSGYDPPPRVKKRSSAAAVMIISDERGNDVDYDTEARSSLEQAPPPQPQQLPLRINGAFINPELFPLPPSRPGSAAAMYSPAPQIRASGSTTSASSSGSTNTASSSSSAVVTPSANSGTTVIRRKKSRPQLYAKDDDDDESDGADADGEYVPSGLRRNGTASSWVNVNVEGRKKLGRRTVGGGGGLGDADADAESRRHSLAV